MKRQIAKLGGAAFGAALALAANGAARAADAPYDIHVILELSGGGAFIGNSEKKAIELVEKTVNDGGGIAGRKIRFVFHDDQTNPQVSVQLANDVLATHPAAVIGPTILGDCRAMAPLFTKGPVLICITPSFDPPKNSDLYSGDISTRSDAIAGINYFRLKGLNRIALITSTDASGQDAKKNIEEILKTPENKALSLVADVTFNPTDVSAAAQMAQVKAANPQAIIAWSVGSPVSTVFRGLRDAGIDVPVATSPGNEVYPEMEQFKAFLPKELYFFTDPWPAHGNTRLKLDPAIVKNQEEFFQAFEKVNAKPDQGSTEGWQPAMLVVGALRSLGTNATAAQIQTYLQQLKGFASVSGFYDFVETPQRGLGVKNTLVSRWNPEAGRWDAVSDLGGALIP